MIGEKPLRISEGNYYDQDPYNGITPRYQMFGIIKDINDYNEKIYLELLKKELDDKIIKVDIQGIYDVLKYCSNLPFEYFKKTFPILFNIIADEYDEIVLKTIYRLISSIDSSYITNIKNEINDSIKNKFNGSEIGLIKKARFNELRRFVSDYEYHIYEQEAYEELLRKQEEEECI